MSFYKSFPFFYTQSPKRNPLVYLYIIPYNGRFANYNSCSVIYSKIIPYFGAGMNFYTGYIMCIFRNSTRQQFQILFPYLMRETINGNGKKPGIGIKNFLQRFC